MLALGEQVELLGLLDAWQLEVYEGLMNSSDTRLAGIAAEHGVASTLCSQPELLVPGLGVELDHDALARLHEQYLVCGITERSDTLYMQSLHPDYRAELPRW